MQHPVLLRDRLPQTGRQRELLHGVVATGREHDVSTRLLLLRLIHRRVRVLQQGLRVLRVLREQADAERPRRVEGRPGQIERLLERLADPFRHRLGDLHRRVRCVGIVRTTLQIAEQDEELVAALPGDQVGVTRAQAQPVAELREQQIAGVVSERVVHQLEVVEIEVQHAYAQVVAPGAGDGALEHLLEQDPVGQARELVVVRKERDLLLGALAFGDVEDHALDEPGVPPFVVDGERLLQHPPDGPVLVHHPVLVVEGEVVAVRILILVPGAFDVVGVHVVAPRREVAEPYLRLDPDQIADLRTHVDRTQVLVHRIEVDHGGDVLDQRAVLRLGFEASLATGVELGRVTERDHEEPLRDVQRTDMCLDRDRRMLRVPTRRFDPGSLRKVQEVRGDQQLDRASDELTPREPGELLDVPVRVHDAAVGLGHDEALRRRLQQRPGLDPIRQLRRRHAVGAGLLQPETHPEKAFQPGDIRSIGLR